MSEQIRQIKVMAFSLFTQFCKGIMTDWLTKYCVTDWMLTLWWLMRRLHYTLDNMLCCCQQRIVGGYGHASKTKIKLNLAAARSTQIKNKILSPITRMSKKNEIQLLSSSAQKCRFLFLEDTIHSTFHDAIPVFCWKNWQCLNHILS